MGDINKKLTDKRNWEYLRGGDVRSLWDFCVERFVKKFVSLIYLILEIISGEERTKI